MPLPAVRQSHPPVRLGRPVQGLRRVGPRSVRSFGVDRLERGLERADRGAEHVVARFEREQVDRRRVQRRQLRPGEVVDPELAFRVGAEHPHPLGADRHLVVVARSLGPGRRTARREELDHRQPEAAQLDEVGQVVGHEDLAQLGGTETELVGQVGQRKPLRVQLEDAQRLGERRQAGGVHGDLAHGAASRNVRSSASISSRTSSGPSSRTRVPSS